MEFRASELNEKKNNQMSGKYKFIPRQEPSY